MVMCMINDEDHPAAHKLQIIVSSMATTVMMKVDNDDHDDIDDAVNDDEDDDVDVEVGVDVEDDG